jgi:hypothetical protein
MTQAELSALRDALDLILQLPANAREQVGQWLTPEAAKPNGVDRDRHPLVAPTPRPAKERAAARRRPPSGGC